MCLFQGEAGAPGENGGDGLAGEQVRRIGLNEVQRVIIRVISSTKGERSLLILDKAG